MVPALHLELVAFLKREAREQRMLSNALVAGILVAGLLSGATAQGPSSSCVTCHTDAARLKALTPADPPSAEAGEG